MSTARRFAFACVLSTVGFGAYGASPTNAIPTFNIRAACRALAHVPEARLAGVGDADATKNCLADERQARAQVAKEWLKFKPVDRRKCVGVSAQGGTEPVYTELLTCLEMAVRPEGANHQWRKNPPGELLIDPVADERLVRATARVGAS